MIGYEAIFTFKNKTLKGVITNISSELDLFYIKVNDETLKIPVSKILDIPQCHFKDYPENQKPIYTYSSEELLVLWDNARSAERNLFDMARYVLENSSAPNKCFWHYHLGEKFHLVKDTVWPKLYKKVLLANGKTEPHRTVYVKNQYLKLIIQGRTVEFGSHALDRCFERFNVCHENLSILLLDIIENSVQRYFYSKTNGDRENVIYLHNSEYDWAFVVKILPDDRFFIMTTYQPQSYWKKLEILSEKPLTNPAL